MSHNPPRVALHELGARRSYAFTVALERIGELHGLYTEFYSRTRHLRAAHAMDMATGGRFQLERKLRGRHNDAVPEEKVFEAPLSQFLRNRLHARRRPATNAYESFSRSRELSAILADVMKRHAGEFTDAVCIHLNADILRASLPSHRIIVDQAVMVLKLLMPIHEAEGEQYADWVRSGATTYRGCMADIERLEAADLAAADHILAPSPFVVESIAQAYPAHVPKVTLLPYPEPAWIEEFSRGIDETYLQAKYAAFDRERRARPRLLFVGLAGLRKGMQYLLPALKSLPAGSFTCRVVGNVEFRPEVVARYADVAEFVGKRDRTGLRREFMDADIFVFPTLAEGSAGVVGEALAFGLPVITTAAAGSRGVDGSNGFIVPVRNAEAIAEAIERYRSTPGLALSHALEARRTRLLDTQERFQERLRDLLARVRGQT